VAITKLLRYGSFVFSLPSAGNIVPPPYQIYCPVMVRWWLCSWTSHLVYIGTVDIRRPIFFCTKMILLLFLTESNLYLIAVRLVLFWDCTGSRVVIPEEHGAPLLHSGRPEIMRGRSEGLN